MIPTLFAVLIILNGIQGKFITNTESSSFLLQRHMRFLTNDRQYHIRCPYNLNHLTVQLMNYSNEYCFNLYSTTNQNPCQNHQSPCQFHAKPIQLRCHHHSYSHHVDISYQCSYKAIISPPTGRKAFTLHSLSFPENFSDPEESIVLFLISLGTVLTLWIFICCICCLRCGHDRHHHHDRKQWLTYQSYPQINRHLLSKRNNSEIVDQLALRVNPFDSNPMSSLRTTTRFVR